MGLPRSYSHGFGDQQATAFQPFVTTHMDPARSRTGCLVGGSARYPRRQFWAVRPERSNKDSTDSLTPVLRFFNGLPCRTTVVSVKQGTHTLHSPVGGAKCELVKQGWEVGASRGEVNDCADDWEAVYKMAKSSNTKPDSKSSNTKPINISGITDKSTDTNITVLYYRSSAIAV